MSTREELRTQLEGRVGYRGSEYAARLNESILSALRDIHSVNFNFLYKYWTVLNPASGDNYIITTLSSSIRTVDWDNVWRVGPPNVRLIRTSPVAIINNTTTGVPLFYATGGYNVNKVPNLYIGLPRPVSGTQHTVRVYGWEGPPDLEDDDEPEVSKLYGDKPIISGAARHFLKSVEELDKSRNALQDFLLDMSTMESVMQYTGLSFFEKNKLSLLAELSAASTITEAV